MGWDVVGVMARWVDAVLMLLGLVMGIVLLILVGSWVLRWMFGL